MRDVSRVAAGERVVEQFRLRLRIGKIVRRAGVDISGVGRRCRMGAILQTPYIFVKVRQEATYAAI